MYITKNNIRIIIRHYYGGWEVEVLRPIICVKIRPTKSKAILAVLNEIIHRKNRPIYTNVWPNQ